MRLACNSELGESTAHHLEGSVEEEKRESRLEPSLSDPFAVPGRGRGTCQSSEERGGCDGRVNVPASEIDQCGRRGSDADHVNAGGGGIAERLPEEKVDRGGEYYPAANTQKAGYHSAANRGARHHPWPYLRDHLVGYGRMTRHHLPRRAQEHESEREVQRCPGEEPRHEPRANRTNHRVELELEGKVKPHALSVQVNQRARHRSGHNAYEACRHGLTERQPQQQREPRYEDHAAAHAEHGAEGTSCRSEQKEIEFRDSGHEPMKTYGRGQAQASLAPVGSIGFVHAETREERRR